MISTGNVNRWENVIKNNADINWLLQKHRKKERGSQGGSLKLTPESNLKEREDKSEDNGEEEYDKRKEARKHCPEV